MIIKDGRAPFRASGGRRRKSIALASIFAVCLGLGGTAWYAKSLVRPAGQWVKDMIQPRLSGRGVDFGLVVKALVEAPNHLIQGMLDGDELPRLRLDVKFKHWQKIVGKRQEALARGVLLVEDDDDVPAIITDGHQAYRAKVRLKGDLLDHLQTKAWSLRVSSKGPFFGMRRFSLQHPRTRGYALNPLFFFHLRREGVLAPRYHFVKVTVNGTDWGVMELEEFVGIEFLESQGRKDGLLGRFDDDAHWENIAANSDRRSFDLLPYGPYNNYWTAEFRAYRAKKLEKNPVTASNLVFAHSLIASYQEGALPPGDVFDLEGFAKYLVVSALWGSFHSQYFDNIRLYLNPYTLKFEPIAGDTSPLGLLHSSTLHTRMIVSGFMRDPAFRKALAESIEQVTGSILNGGLFGELKSEGKRIQDSLHREYPFLLDLDLSTIHKNAALLAQYGAAFFPMVDGQHPERPPFDDNYQRHVLVRAYNRPSRKLVISNMLHQAVKVENVTAWCTNSQPQQGAAQTAGSGQPTSADIASPAMIVPTGRTAHIELAVGATIGPTVLGGRATRLEIDLPETITAAACEIKVTTSRLGSQEIRTVAVSRWIDRLDRHPLSTGGRRDAESVHRSWLSWNAEARRYETTAGDWQIDSPLVIPEGVGLWLNAGTRLAFAPGAYLLVNGPLDIAGVAARPVVLEPQDVTRPWSGIFVMAAGRPSRWQHVEIYGTTALEDGPLKLTGGVTFYRSDVTMTDVAFVGTEAEDALNIVRSSFVLERIAIRNARSDGFDCDYCEGTITHSTFFGLGGDAVDLSGTRATIEDLEMETVRDKALSVGEKSEVVVRNLEVKNVGTAIASKDDSYTNVIGATIESARIAGLMSYVKKTAYGPGRIDATNVTIGEHVATPALAQTGSVIVLNGERIAETDLDVKQLYSEGLMKK